jgi:hypothetical protein
VNLQILILSEVPYLEVGDEVTDQKVAAALENSLMGYSKFEIIQEGLHKFGATKDSKILKRD